MREIKFRAWNGKEMYFFDLFSTGIDGHFIAGSEIMQYTGLKDENETDIYEGDVVNTVFEFGAGRPALVKIGPFEYEGNYSYGPNLHHYEGPLYSPPLTEYMVRVIGNLYETPELIETELA